MGAKGPFLGVWNPSGIPAPPLVGSGCGSANSRRKLGKTGKKMGKERWGKAEERSRSGGSRRRRAGSGAVPDKHPQMSNLGPRHPKIPKSPSPLRGRWNGDSRIGEFLNSCRDWGGLTPSAPGREGELGRDRIQKFLRGLGGEIGDQQLTEFPEPPGNPRERDRGEKAAPGLKREECGERNR